MSVTYKGKKYKVKTGKKKRKGVPEHIVTSLNLSRKKITDISEIKGLENLTQLEWLYLEKNSISEINGLENLTQLEWLNLEKNSISKIGGLENLTQLKFLKLNNNSISEIDGLGTLTNLKRLGLSYNPIETLKGLDNLENLEFLNLFNCKIHQIESFNNKEFLRQIILGNNPIYRDLETALSKKFFGNKDSNLGISPKIWEIVTNTKSITRKNLYYDSANKTRGGKTAKGVAGTAGESAACCLECISLVVFLIGFNFLLPLFY